VVVLEQVEKDDQIKNARGRPLHKRHLYTNAALDSMPPAVSTTAIFSSAVL
jgi:hypothetical protein